MKINDEVLNRYFINVDFFFKRMKILFVVKKVVVDYFNYILYIWMVCLLFD